MGGDPPPQWPNYFCDLGNQTEVLDQSYVWEMKLHNLISILKPYGVGKVRKPEMSLKNPPPTHTKDWDLENPVFTA